MHREKKLRQVKRSLQTSPKLEKTGGLCVSRTRDQNSLNLARYSFSDLVITSIFTALK